MNHSVDAAHASRHEGALHDRPDHRGERRRLEIDADRVVAGCAQ